MSWSPEYYPQTGEALVSDLDGVVHGDHHGIGLKLWHNIASSGLWDSQTNSIGMNGTEAAQAFSDAIPEDAGFRELDDLGHRYLFDFVEIGRVPIEIDIEIYLQVLYETASQICQDYAHAEIIEEIAEIIACSGRPGIFITNSPLTPASILINQLFPNLSTMVFSPFDIKINDGTFSLRIATPEVRINKGSYAITIMSDLQIEPSRTIGFGDTESDIPLLEVLGRPIAINPTIGLRAFAARQGIEIRDVIRQ